ncbi:hypothetical protein N431DRAFT_445083 [Stipitochalara longipes BDJ]|nr:hypothetical protein N431DRAFT_445083 [Stipitochalara longipes BDJ]
MYSTNEKRMKKREGDTMESQERRAFVDAAREVAVVANVSCAPHFSRIAPSKSSLRTWRAKKRREWRELARWEALGTEGQRDRGTEGQRDRGTEGERERGGQADTERGRP